MATTLLVLSASLSTSYTPSSRSKFWSALTDRPRMAQDAPSEILQTHVLSSKFGKFSDINGKPVNGFVSQLARPGTKRADGQWFNGIHYKNQIYNPLFTQIQAGKKVDPKLVASATFDGIGGGDIIVCPHLMFPASIADVIGEQPGRRYPSPFSSTR